VTDTPPGAFASATHVQRDPEHPQRWHGHIPPGWDIVGNTNGGLLLALATRAITSATQRPDPVTVTGHFMAPGQPGPATIEVEVLRPGGRHATARAVMSTDRPVLSVMATTADLSAAHEPVLIDGGPPDVPPPEQCHSQRTGPLGVPPFVQRVDQRLHPDDGSFHDPSQKSGQALMRGWFRLRDGEPLDTVALVLASDAFPPTVFNTHLPIAWTPTVELTVHIRARPAPGWLRAVFRTRFVSQGYLEADGEVWDGDDRLVAQSRQLALVPREQ
jgi:acyl-CoA thioesterase